MTRNNDRRPVSQTVRDEIVEAGRRIFAKFGFRKATVDEIANAAGKKKSSVYHYFAGKEEIFEAVLEREARLFRGEIGKAVAEKQTARERVQAYVIARMKTFKRLVNFYSAFREGYLDNYPFIEKIRLSYDNEEVEYLKSLLRFGIERAEFIIRDPDTASVAIVTAMKGLEFRLGNEPDDETMIGHINDMLDILFHGIVKR